jgi:hypothetical protein
MAETTKTSRWHGSIPGWVDQTNGERLRDVELKEPFPAGSQGCFLPEPPNICTIYEIDEADGRIFIAGTVEKYSHSAKGVLRKVSV